MRSVIFVGFFVVLVAGLAACGQGPESQLNSLDDGSVGRTSEAINETAYDRPVAAGISRVVSGKTYYYVFACGADSVMRRKQFDVAAGTWGSWFTVANTFACASPPTVGKWIGGTPSETMFVYYRSTANRLIEATYNSDGSTSAVDVTAALAFGNIAGTPALVDAIDVSGMSNRVSVAVRRGSDNKLFTLDYYQGAWHTQAMLKSDGSYAFAASNTFGVTYGQYDRSYLSAQTDGNTNIVFTRSGWTQPYKGYQKFTGFPGVITFGIPNECFDGGGCTMFRTSSVAQIGYNGLTNSGIHSYFDVNTSGPAVSPSTGDYANAYVRGSSGQLWRLDFEYTPATNIVDVGPISSAPSMVSHAFSLAMYAKLVGGTQHLFFHDGTIGTAGTTTDLAYPGGLLAP